MALLSKNTLKGFLALSFTLGLLATGLCEKSWSDMVVEDLKAPVTAILQEALSVENTKAGDMFMAVTEEDYLYKTSILPAGSRIIGRVEKVKKSKRLGRPGYLQLKITQVEFPDGSNFLVPKTYLNKRNKEKKVKAQRHYSPDAKTKSGMMKSNMASMIAGSSTTIALTSIGTFSSPYALGARVIAGAVWEGFKGNKEKPLYKRMAKGGWRGTGVPGAYYYVTKQPNPSFEANGEIQLHMQAEVLEELLEANNNPDVDWEKPDFKQVTWDDYESIENYTKMAEQLQDVPDATLSVDAKINQRSKQVDKIVEDFKKEGFKKDSNKKTGSENEVYSPVFDDLNDSGVFPEEDAYESYDSLEPNKGQKKSSNSSDDSFPIF